MSLEFNIQALIAQATKEYTQVAKNNPIVESLEDGTIRGDDLNTLLAQQDEEKKKLWKQFHKLEKERVEKGNNIVIESPLPTNRKELLKLMTMDQQLVQKITLEMEKVNIVDRPSEAILEVQFREKLALQIEQFKETIDILNQELLKVNQSITSEDHVLKECQYIGNELKKQEKELNSETSTETNSMDKLRKELATLEKKYNNDIQDMTDFLDAAYPPHPIDKRNPTSDECDLKVMIEQLLNQAYRHPESPYLPLEPETYWPLYVEVLIKGRIAEYHPQDKTLIALNNFNLYE